MSLATVAIIGRPNTGKSTLFNAFIGERRSIVSDIAGTTRDSLVERVWGEKYSYYLVDTAGLTDAQGDSLELEIQTQAAIALEKADLLIFVVDGKTDPTSDDYALVERLRKSPKPVLFVANKIDDGDDSRTWNLAALGLGMPMAISAKNFVHIYDLEDTIEAKLSELGFRENAHDEEETMYRDWIKVAFVGRPNVGKSCLTNKLVGTSKSVVSDVRGTTRDTIDTPYETDNGQKFLLLDTAGLRKPGKRDRSLEFWSAVRTEKAIERADICVLVIDALDGVTHQDLTVAGKILEAGKGVLVCVNKFDLAIEKSRAETETDERVLPEVKMWDERLDKIREKYLGYLAQKIKFMNWAPVVFVSAKTGKGIDSVFENCENIYTEISKRVSTAELNKYVPEIYYGHVQPSIGTKIGKIKFASQVDTKPPTFLFHVNNQKAFHFTYKRYLENKIREKYGFHGTPIVVKLADAMDGRDEKKKKRR